MGSPQKNISREDAKARGLKRLIYKKAADRNKKWLIENFFSRGCFYCRKKLSHLVMQVEHRVPQKRQGNISKSGLPYYRKPNTWSKYFAASIKTLTKVFKDKNLVPSCANCNFVKSKTLDKGTPEGKRQWRAYLREIRKNIHKDTKRTQHRNKATTK